MAGKFTIEAVFKALDRMTNPIVAMQKRLDSFQKASERVSKGLRGISDANSKVAAAAKTGALAATAAGASLGLVADNVVNAGADFEQAITDVGAVSLLTRKEVADLEKKALELGASTKFSATEVANGMELMGKAGFTNAEILDGIGGILAAAAADGGELAETAGHVSNVLKGMGLEASQAGRVADVLTLASSRTNSSIGSLGESMKNVASTARQFNIPLEDAIASVALLQDVGLDASEAGSAVNTMLTQMAAPSDVVKAKMRALGVSFQDAQGNMLPIADVLGQLEKSAAKSGGNMAQVAFFAELVGLRGQKAAGNLKDLFKSGKFAALTTELRGAAGSAEKMAGIRMNTFRGDVETLGGSIDSLKIKLFDMQSGPLRGVVQGMTKWIDANQGLIATRVQDFIAQAIPIVREFAVGIADGAKGVRSFVGGIESVIGPLDQLFGSTATERIANAHALGKMIVEGTAAFVAFSVATKAAQVAVVAFNVVTNAGRVALFLYRGALAAANAATVAYWLATHVGVGATISMALASKAAVINLGAQKVAAYAAAAGMKTLALQAGAAAAAIGAVLLAKAANDEFKAGTEGMGVFDALIENMKNPFNADGSVKSLFQTIDEHQNKLARTRAANEQAAAAGPLDAKKFESPAWLQRFDATTPAWVEQLQKSLPEGPGTQDVQRGPNASTATGDERMTASQGERGGTRVERSVTEMKDKLEITIRDESGKAEVTKTPARGHVRLGASGGF